MRGTYALSGPRRARAAWGASVSVVAAPARGARGARGASVSVVAAPARAAWGASVSVVAAPGPPGARGPGRLG